jgi:hypothetical protein
MKRKVLVALVLFLFAVAFKVHAYDNGDFQVWNTYGEEKKIDEKSRITAEEEQRWGDNANQLYYHHYDIGFVYTVNKNFDLGLNYRRIYERKKGKLRLENEPNINAILKWDLWGFSLSDRNRIEYRHFDYQGDSWRYRNTFTVRAPWKFTRFKIQPYLADEIFISSMGVAFNNNRFYSGLGFTLTKSIRGELYYMLQHTRTVNKNSTNWPFVNVLGTKIKLAF